MNKHLQRIIEILRQDQLTTEQREEALKVLKEAEKEFEITEFKLNRTEKAKRTTEVLFEETIAELEQKRKAIVIQNRELEVEAALERVRSQTMAMRSSEDVGKCIVKMFSELTALGIDEGTRFGIGILNHDNENNQLWTARKDGEEVKMHVGNIDMASHPLLKSARKAWKEQVPFHQYILEGQDLLDYYQMLNNAPDYKIQIPLEQLPEREIQHCFIFEHGFFYAFSPKEFQPELIQITKRFSSQFAQTYRRYQDLVRAESQAREAQIEAALERVRAKTMAMHNSEDVSSAIATLFSELDRQGIENVRCGIAIIDANKTMEVWSVTNVEETHPDKSLGKMVKASGTLDMNAHKLWQLMYDAWRNKTGYLYYHLSGKDKQKYLELINTAPGYLSQPLRELPDMHCQFYFFNEGAIWAYSLQPHTEPQKPVVKRFTSVFSQTYLRYQDLQKAEAQAMEAQIEAALERVRSRTMAMQKSNELPEVAFELFEQMHHLGFARWGASISLADETRGGFNVWYTTPEKRIFSESIFLPNQGHPLAEKIWNVYKQQIELSTTELRDEEKLDYDQWMFANTPHENMPESVKGGILSERYVMFSLSAMKYGFLESISLEPIPAKLNEILPRFAKVFEQTYTRFLDLQKAEAQAREAQIQLSLERIRAKAMAMQHSDELSDFLTVLFEQFDVLNTSPVYCQLSLIDIENNRNIFRMTGKKGSTLIASQKVDLNASTVWKQKVSDWKAGNPNDVDVLYIPKEIIPEMAEIFKEIWSKLPEGEYPTPEDFPNGSYVVEGYCKYGYIGYTASRAPSEEEKEITRRIANEFGNVYQRFIDLEKAEAQAREAQIEAALERIRSKTMAMHKSDQLPETAQVLFEQFVLLGKIPDRISIGIFNEELQVIELWVTDQTGSQLASHFNTSFLKPTISEFFAAWKKGKDSIIVDLSGDALKEWIAYVRDEVKMPIDESKIKGRRVHHAAFFSQGMLLISAHEPMLNETMQLLVRFAKVFSQTYTRFLDLQKAEAQAREAQIEAGLERVRSKTMAMHSSEDVDITVITLFEELVKLGVDKSIRTGIGIMDLSRKMEVWTASVNFSGQTTLDKGVLDMGAHQLLIEAQEAWEAKESTHTYELIGDDLINYFKSINDTPDYSFQIDLEKLPGKIIHYDFYFPEGVLFAFSPVPFSEETARLFSRFAAVFAQTYRRFLDLQKAEAQARESEIEVALEKVRSRSLAMHKSDELKDVVFSVFERLRDLQIQTDSTNIVVYHDESKKMEVWIANDMNYATKFSLPMTGRFYPIETRKDQKFFMQHLPFEEKNRFWEELFETSDFRKVPKARKNFLLEKTDCLIQLVAFGKLTGIMLNRHFNTPFSDAEIEIAERFAKVFDQAYTRFLDLQKAEKQAREAQIEAALEKVRSRSLAMQSPDELIEVAQLLREEMGALGVEELETSSIYIHDASSGLTECWFTIKNTANPAKAVTDQMTIKLEDTWVGRQMREFFHSPAERTSIVMRGENRLEWIHYCEGKTNLFGTSNFYGDTIPDRTYHLYKFSNGYIGAAAPGEISLESWDLLRRATTVFSFAYTRFQDLQNAQASARAAMRQASLDRIRADISSMRNADDLDRITPLIFKELTVLGVPFIRCGVFIINEKQELVEAYLSSPDGNSLGVLRLPYQASELTFQTVKAWRKGEIYKRHWNKEDFIQWINQLMEQDQIQDSSTYQGTAAPPESLDLHFVPFTQGMLYVGAVNPLEENDLELVQALAKAFSIAYARYEDFVKLENAKADVESAMRELKATQTQLVQQEKLASLGQLTAGIAHEIKNPLNFVNNFSEVSLELIEEALEEIAQIEDNKHAIESAEILADIKSNLTKIHEHGTRANGIVSSMLQHSRGGTGKMEPTDLNALIKEYVTLSFHGMRAGKNPINVDIILDLDPAIKEVSLIKEDFTRVIINLCNNAFDAMRGKVDLTGFKGYLPTLKVTTSQLPPEGGKGGYFKIAIQDNGPGIPDEIKDKILQPFFTTKKGTEGTGLGLSITHDIVKAHGGELKVETKENEGTEFTVHLPT